MTLRFNALLQEAALFPKDVRLLRHSDTGARKGRSAFELWRDDHEAFLLYQSVQDPKNRPFFSEAPYWASFGSMPGGETVFLGLYQVQFRGVGLQDLQRPHAQGLDEAGKYHLYEVLEAPLLREYAGRLYVEWGLGLRRWIQRADNQDKAIIELRREFRDPEFPGFVEFVEPLSRIEALPSGWRDALRSSKGVYLLTCPRTKEQYVGKADGADGFLGRWLFYAASGHGGNVGLKSRDASDYQVSILEVAGSAASATDILKMEDRWKRKLLSREMGLNRN